MLTPEGWADWRGMLNHHRLILERLGVVWVVCAANHGFFNSAPDTPIVKLGELLPNALGKPGNSLITVGAVNRVGRLCEWSTPEGAPTDSRYGTETGSITTYALGQSVETWGLGGKPNPELVHGTSFSSPIVVCKASPY